MRDTDHDKTDDVDGESADDATDEAIDDVGDESADSVEREDGFEHEDAVEREDGFEHEDAVEREDAGNEGEGFERGDGLVQHAHEGGVGANDEVGESDRSTPDERRRSGETVGSGIAEMQSTRTQSTGTQSAVGEQDDTGSSAHAGLARARKVGTALDHALTVPGTSFQVGLDPILGIVPGGGDAVAAVGSLYIVLEAARAGVPRAALKKMLALVAVDLVAGSVPLVGVLFDAVWKANKWNVATFEEHVQGDAR